MIVTLSPQLPVLTEQGLESAAHEQKQRLSRVKNIIADANARIEAAISAARPNFSGLSSDERRLMQQAAERNGATIRIRIRRETDNELVPIIKQINSAAKEAKDRAERHYDKFSILRRATNGNGAFESFQKRAALATILDQAGEVELARWAQLSIDTGDPVMADAVIRANNSRPNDGRGFQSAQCLNLLPNGEHERTNAILQSVIDMAEEAGLAYSEFERGRADNVRRIALALKKQPVIKQEVSA